MKLYKTTIVIWSEHNPQSGMTELEDIAREATSGNAYCSKELTELVNDPSLDSDWDNNEFFGEHE